MGSQLSTHDIHDDADAVVETRSDPETGMWQMTPGKWASIRQPHWHRRLDV